MVSSPTRTTAMTTTMAKTRNKHMPVTIKTGHKLPYAVASEAFKTRARMTRDGRLVENTYITDDPFTLSQLSLIDQVRDLNMSVLITGESGTGKDIMAKRLGHRHTLDASGLHTMAKYISVNCAGITDSLFESEMFGHIKGSFTGALRDRAGFFQAAHGGTLFLDEIGDLPLHQQAKLLRVLENKTVTPVGSTEEIHVSPRIVCATNKNLRQAIIAGEFREDLYYRIAQVVVSTIPLRMRSMDVVLIANEIIATNDWTPLASNETIPTWAYSRGNVRRLYACIQLRELGLQWDEIAEQWDWSANA